MSNEDGEEWTVNTSRIDLLSRINDADRRYEQMFKSLESALLTGLAGQKEAAAVALVPVGKALDQASIENSKRFDTLTVKIDALVSQVTASDASNLSLAVNMRDRRAGSSVIAMWIFGALGLMIAIASMVSSIRTAMKP